MEQEYTIKPDPAQIAALTAAEAVDELIAIAYSTPLAQITASLSDEEISKIVSRFGDDPAFNEFVARKSAELTPQYSDGVSPGAPPLSAERILEIESADALVDYISNFDLAELAAILTRDQVNDVLEKYRFVPNFREHLKNNNVELPETSIDALSVYEGRNLQL